ncbi:hypothetical protein FB45DRAFT_1064509 [Roridomyces roridus]|uniref:Inhibitor I9 domain-containing protein n=1 Tax=Roridomyces roridus TaxID=1738132 RepID=A0AAD7BAB0_9AGAR|nr:hypothetical protein FB45DRAFT_1064509 [Roridomyces roridus]
MNKRYIVRLKDGVDQQAHFTSLRQAVNFTVVDAFDPAFLNAYVVALSESDLAKVMAHEDVLRVEEDAEDVVE